MDLIGIPLRVVLGERGLRDGVAELKARADADAQDVPLASVVSVILERVAGA